MPTKNYQLTTINYKEMLHNTDIAFPGPDRRFYKKQVYNHYRLIG